VTRNDDDDDNDNNNNTGTYIMVSTDGIIDSPVEA
jgi:hypothetical protein